MKNVNTLFALTILLALAAVGCKKGAVSKLNTAAPPPTMHADWTTYDAGTFTIAGPSGWGTKPPGAIPVPGLEEGGAMTDSGAPVPGGTESVGAGTTEGLLFTLFDRRARPLPGESMTRMEAKRESGYSDLASAIEEAKRSTGEKAFQKVTLPVGEAAVFKVTSKTVGGDEVHNVVYVIAHNGDMYKFTWETTNQQMTSIESVAGPMMETLRVKA